MRSRVNLMAKINGVLEIWLGPPYRSPCQLKKYANQMVLQWPRVGKCVDKGIGESVSCLTWNVISHLPSLSILHQTLFLYLIQSPLHKHNLNTLSPPKQIQDSGSPRTTHGHKEGVHERNPIFLKKFVPKPKKLNTTPT